MSMSSLSFAALIFGMAKKKDARARHRLYTPPGLARNKRIAGCCGMGKLATAHETTRRLKPVVAPDCQRLPSLALALGGRLRRGIRLTQSCRQGEKG